MVFLYVVLRWGGDGWSSQELYKIGCLPRSGIHLVMAHRPHRVTRSQSSDGDFVYRGQLNDGNVPRVSVPEGDRFPR